MRTDDPVILQQIQALENAAESLRRICGFPPLNAGPEVTASRAPKWCGQCALGFQSTQDLAYHQAHEHGQEAA